MVNSTWEALLESTPAADHAGAATFLELIASLLLQLGHAF